MALATVLGVLGAVAVAVAAIALTSSRAPTEPAGGAAAAPGAAAHAARPPAFDGPAMPAGFRTTNFSLPDQNGRWATLSAYHGRVVALTFMHSLCHDTCPLIAQQIRGALNQLPPAARADVSVLAISVDPREDTQANTRRFVAAQHLTGRMRFLHGTRAQLAPVWHTFSVEPLVETDKVDAHTSMVILVDRNGHARVGYGISDITPDALAHDMRILVRQ